MSDNYASQETVFMLASRVEQLQAEVNKLQYAIRENACILYEGKKFMLGWARQALGEEISDSTTYENYRNRLFND